MSRFTNAFLSLSFFLLAVTGVGNIAKAQVDPPTDIGGTSGMIAPNTFSLCAGSPLTLTASCGSSSAIFPVWPDRNRTFDLVVEPGVNVYEVFCSDEVNDSEPVSVTVIGGCVEICAAPPAATDFKTIGTLNGVTCSIELSAQVTGKYFVFTGPDGYVYSVVHSACQAGTTVIAKEIKAPGTYTLRVYNDALVPRGTLRDLPEGGFTTTVEVGGTACPAR